MNRIKLFLLSLIITLISCTSPQQKAHGKDTITIVCTTGMIADIVAQLAGERAEVKALMGPGIDPHLYRPTRTDIARLTAADLVFYNGLMLEGKFTDALRRVGRSGTPVHALAETIDRDLVLQDEEDRDADDPHLWMDPLVWLEVAMRVKEALSEFDPEGSVTYFQNMEILSKEIQALHDYAKRVLGSVPDETRVLITAHDAFQYFGRRYNIQVEGIQGLSTESEAGVRDIERLVNLLVSRGIPAVFIETTVSERNIKALIEGARARGHEVRIGGELFSDALGPAGSYRGTYVGMIDHNVTTIARELGGQAPERGFNGRL